MSIKIKHSLVFTKIKNAKTRIIVNEGSSRSTKTYSIIQYLIFKALEKKRKITICRKFATWLRGTVVVDFIDVLNNHFSFYEPQRFNKSELIYKFPNGSEIAFIGLDEPQKMHGRKQDIFWINEAVESDYKDFEQLVIRTVEQGILDYNPSYEQHWIYDKVIPRDDCTFIKSTYKDNPFLSEDIVKEIERLEPTPENIAQGTADETSWKIYGKGERAAHKGLIFKDAKIVDCLPNTNHWKKSFYGLDFGFTNDPTALLHIVYAHGEIWIDQIIYERGLTNIINETKPNQRSIQSLLKENKVSTHANIWADSAEPKSIQDLCNCGYNVRATKKGPDSIKNGIDVLLRYKINITKRSRDLIKEKDNYKWKEDRSGKSLNEPIDKFNHGWDAGRYGVSMEMESASSDFSIHRVKR